MATTRIRTTKVVRGVEKRTTTGDKRKTRPVISEAKMTARRKRNW